MKKVHIHWRLLAILVALLGMALACAPWRQVQPPGEGPKAEAGYAACEPVIQALAAYHADHHVYPESLAALSPDYLETVPDEVNELAIVYQQEEEAYSLRFSYTGPGMNHCTYTPDAGWDCYGYY
jgi:hypothetical protein